MFTHVKGCKKINCVHMVWQFWMCTWVDVTTAPRPESFKCKNGQYTEAVHRCLMEFNDYGHHVGCRDGSHLVGCGKLLL